MTRAGRVAPIVIVAAVLLLLPSSVVDGHPQGAAPLAPGTAITSHAPAPPASASAPPPLLSQDRTAAPSPGSPTLATTALRASSAFNVPTLDAFLPRPSATPSEIAAANASGHVAPLYGGSGPAPMGLVDYGLSAGTGGAVVPSWVNATGVRGSVSIGPGGIQPLYLTAAAPDGYSVVLGASSRNVTLGGVPGFTFWFEDVAEYFAGSQRLVFIANVWNFSSGTMPPGTFESLGNASEVGTSYAVATDAVAFRVSTPFSVSLALNSSIVGGRDAVSFAASVASSGGNASYPFEQVVFNSTASGGLPLTVPAALTAEGSSYNPVGLTDDFELVLGGPGGGAQTNLFRTNATMTLDLWNATRAAYEPVPSAYSYGGDAAETVSGATVGWSNPGNPQAQVSEGPAIERGLWNASGASGLDPVVVALSVPNAFLFFTTRDGSNFSAAGAPYWAPDSLTTRYALPPGSYDLRALLSNYDPILVANLSVPLGGSATVSVDLVANTSEGIYTPLWAWGDAQIPTISMPGGAGTPSNPYRLANDPPVAIGSLFGAFNDLTFPVFSGVLLANTRSSTLLAHMPELAAASPYSFTPARNDLSFQLYNTSGVGLIDTPRLSGWFTDLLAGEFPRWATDSVVLWNSTADLVANDTFATQTAGLFLYGGSNNTVWGNTFTMVPTPPFPNGTLLALNLSLGLEDAESSDLIYDNAFDTTVTAYTPLGDLYSGGYFVPSDRWNITPTAASSVNYVTSGGFPGVALTGSIIRSATQGGNYWWDYGTPQDPYGLLPYAAGGEIAVGGDEAPLLSGPLAAVTVEESGLTPGTHWSLEVHNATSSLTLDASVVTGSSTTILLPENGSYAGVGTAGSLGASVTFRVTGPMTVTLPFAPTYAATFTETGLPGGSHWGVHVDYRTLSSTGPQVVVPLGNGSWNYSVRSPAGYASTPALGAVDIAGAPAHVNLSFTPVLYPVSFVPTGLAAGAVWYVRVAGQVLVGNGSSPLEIELANGSYSASYNATVYTVTPASGGFQVLGGPVSIGLRFVALPSYAASFVEVGLPAGQPWAITIDGVATAGSANASIVFELANESNPYVWQVDAVGGYVASPGNGSFSVAGTPLSIGVAFTPLDAVPVTFTEGGLPAGANWSVNVTGGLSETTTAASPSIGFLLPPGHYDYRFLPVPGYAAYPTGGAFVVSNRSLNFTVQFTAVTPGVYVVSFTETGLPAGWNWSVSLGPMASSSTAATIDFLSTNGTFPWLLGTVPGFLPAPASGTLTIAGQNAAVSSVFTPTPPGSYLVTFVEIGLPLGTPWSVVLGSAPGNSTGTTILFTERNASYAFAVGSVRGFSANLTGGTLAVAGAPTTLDVQFTRNPVANTFLGIGYLEWAVVLVALAALAAAVGVLLRRRARRDEARRSPPPPGKPGA